MQLYIFFLIIALIAFVIFSAFKREVIEDDEELDENAFRRRMFETAFEPTSDREESAKRHAVLFAVLVAERLADRAKDGAEGNSLFDKALAQFQAFDAETLVDAAREGKNLSEICLTDDVREYLDINI